MNSIVGPIFNKKVIEKCNLWVCSEKVNKCWLKKKKKREEKRGFQQNVNV